jgi:hypothetical protein
MTKGADQLGLSMLRLLKPPYQRKMLTALAVLVTDSWRKPVKAHFINHTLHRKLELGCTTAASGSWAQCCCFLQDIKPVDLWRRLRAVTN